MEIVVYAEQFRSGSWDVWEHICSPKEVQAVVDSVRARANDRGLGAHAIHDDFLEAVRSMFDVMRDAATNPRDGDRQVYCVCVDQLVIGVYEKIRQYSQRITETHELIEIPLRKSA